MTRPIEAYLREPYAKVLEVFKTRKAKALASDLPSILFMSSYPPRECGIATYSNDLLRALDIKYENSFNLQVCALEQGESNLNYPSEVSYVLDTTYSNGYDDLAKEINENVSIEFVMIQHEFGFFQNKHKKDFLRLLMALKMPVIVVFHTVLPKPNEFLLDEVKAIAKACDGLIVMTNNAAKILENDYSISPEIIDIIPHGTHLVPSIDRAAIKEKYGLHSKHVLSTFGLLSAGKGIELTLEALPAIVEEFPDTVFLIIGKTHPSVVREEGETYRNKLEEMVKDLHLQAHVKFYNKYLPLNDLLELLQVTDVYLFTSKDPNQAVSGTFSYALSCGCALVSTPIPHALEVLQDNIGIIIDFNQTDQLINAVNGILGNDDLRKTFHANAKQKILSTAWENAAILHANFFKNFSSKILRYEHEKSFNAHYIGVQLSYRLPEINFLHFRAMTSDFGMFQFSELNIPDPKSGYTLDDNSRALIAACMHFQTRHDSQSFIAIKTYLNFIAYCQQANGGFLNYVDIDKKFTQQNAECNLADSNGRAIWALGYLISLYEILPSPMIQQAERILGRCTLEIEKMHSPRAMAFAIKGLYYANLRDNSSVRAWLIEILAKRLLQMYKHESDGEWHWYENYLTYANSLLPEAMLLAGLATGIEYFKQAAKVTFDFLISKTFSEKQIKVVSNQTWMHKGLPTAKHGEQPLDVCYTILALDHFIKHFPKENYEKRIIQSFNWFLGNNHLNQIIYNPCTGGCFDGLEATQVNLNQGAESTVCYLLSRLTIEKYGLLAEA